MPSAEREQALELVRQFAAGIANAQEVSDIRQAYNDFVGQFPVPSEASVESVNAGGVPALWVSMPGAASDRVILYLHGGGYVIGDAQGYRMLAARISQAAQARVLVIDYRLAPENPHPAAVEDATAAYRWLLEQGFQPGRIAVAGDSAGGGLTVATLVSLRDSGTPLPAAGVCISPWVDLEGTGETMTSKAAVDPLVQKETLEGMTAAYLQGQDPKTPLAAPLYADLTGLSPLLIQVGTHETLLDDSNRLAEKARAAGVDVTLEPWEEMIHVWHALTPNLPEAQQAINRMGEYIRQRTGEAVTAR